MLRRKFKIKNLFDKKSRSRISHSIPNCELTGVREQTNVLTTWLDASHTYGSTANELRNVRDGSNSPFLKQKRNSNRRGRALLPKCSEARTDITSCEDVCEEEPTRQCFASGEQRANEQPGLATMHTVWFREHNRLATELESLNPHWDGERVFQEARRILIAQWQHIIYNEWLPILLGQQYMRRFNLFPTTSEYTNNYDESIDPRINNEFSTAAFRFVF